MGEIKENNDQCKRCKTCKHFSYQQNIKNEIKKWKFENDPRDFIIGFCELEPVDWTTMESNHMAIQCSHDGGITVGENFGCVNHKSKEKYEMKDE